VATVTLEQLQTDALLYCDQRPGGANAHINTATELTRLINQALKEFYDLLISVRGQEYYITSTTLSVVDGIASYNLPAAFYQLGSVTLEWSATDHEIVRPLASLAERSDYTPPLVWNRWAPKGYRIRGAQSGTIALEFSPTPTSPVTARVQYIPTMTELAAGQSIDCINGWDKLVTLKVALEMLSIKGNSKQRALIESLYLGQLERVQQMAADRDANEPGRIRDVNPECDRFYPSGWY
jgi:hypothetical protein